MIIIDVVALPLRAEQQHQRWQAWVGDELICTSRTPFFAAARKLLEHGTVPDEDITMRHKGSDRLCLSSTVGAAAKLTVTEDERVGPRQGKYQPYPSD
jgi:hypothetical protein